MCSVRFVDVYIRFGVNITPTDNVAVYSIQRGHSSNFISNLLLGKLFRIAEKANLYIVRTWVSTLVQKADSFSRDSKAKDPILLDEL